MSHNLRCGHVYGFVTRQAVNHLFKYKYHLYLTTTSRHPQQHAFLFINSHGTPDCMRITRADWAGMKKSQSFILCSDLLLYPSTELQTKKLSPRGRLSDDAMKRLMQHIEDGTMKEHQVDIVLDALTGYFGG